MGVCYSSQASALPEPAPSCTILVLHPALSAKPRHLSPFSFKAWARDQILLQRKEIEIEREEHKHELEELRYQYEEDLRRLRARVESSEGDWQTLDARLGELRSNVEGIQQNSHPQNPPLLETPSHTPNNAQLQLQLKLKLTSSELEEWRTAFKHLSGTPEQRATNSKAAAEELEQWRAAFNHVSGTPAQRAAASKDFARKFQQGQAQNTHHNRCRRELESQVTELQANVLRSQRDIKRHEAEQSRLNAELQGLQEQNANQSTSLKRELAAREKLLGAITEYQKAIVPDSEPRILATDIESGPPSSEHAGSPRSKSTQTPSNKRKHDQDDALQPRKRLDTGNHQRLRSEASWGNMDTLQPKAQIHRNLDTNWRILPAKDTSTGQQSPSSSTEVAKPTFRFPPVRQSAPVSSPARSRFEASRAIEATSRSIGDTETVSPIRAPGSPITVRTPGMGAPVAKKWKNSMLRRG